LAPTLKVLEFTIDSLKGLILMYKVRGGEVYSIGDSYRKGIKIKNCNRELFTVVLKIMSSIDLTATTSIVLRNCPNSLIFSVLL
jgi:hypothetical protein